MRLRADLSISNAVDYQSLTDEADIVRREQSVRFGPKADMGVITSQRL
jgi:hypothetical protein